MTVKTSYHHSDSTKSSWQRESATSSKKFISNRALTTILSKQKSVVGLMTICKEHLDTFNAINCATALHYLGVFGEKGEQRSIERELSTIKRLRERALQELPEFGPREIATSVMGLSKLPFSSSTFFTEVQTKILKERNLTDFTSQDISILSCSFGRKCMGSKDLFSLFEEEILHGRNKNGSRKLHDLTDQAIAPTVYAFTKMRFGSKKLFEVLEEEVLYRQQYNVKKEKQDWNPEDLASTVAAFARSGHVTREMFTQVEDEILCGTLENGLKKIEQLEPQHIAQIVSAFANAGFASEQLFYVLETEILDLYATDKNMFQWDAYSITKTLQAYAKAGFGTDALFSTFADELLHGRDKSDTKKLKKLKTEDIVSLLWSFAVHGRLHEELFSKLISMLASNVKEIDKLHTREKERLLQVQAFLGVELQGAKKVLEDTLEQVLASVKWEDIEKRGISSTHSQISKMLRSFDIEVEDNKYIAPFMCSVFLPEENRIILVNDSSCYMQDRQGKLILNGLSFFKLRLLRAMKDEYGVLYEANAICETVWKKLKTDTERQEYLERILHN